MFNTAIIGLGNIGFQLGLDPLRKETWSHVQAYERCRSTSLVGAVEINEAKAALFREHHPNIPVFATIDELMAKSQVHLVSVCTPVESHCEIVERICEFPGVRGIFCEKPITSTVEEGTRIVEACRSKGTVLAINHLRSWDENYIYAKRYISKGGVGKITAVSGCYPARILNMGSHLLAALIHVTGLIPEKVSGVALDPESADPTISGWIACKGGVPCTIWAAGKREDYVFELDILGSEGRLRISETGGKDSVDFFTFKESPRYSSYREFFPEKSQSITGKDRFIEAVDDIVAVMEGKKESPNCSGADGLRVMSTCSALLESSRKGSIPVAVDC